MNDYQNAAGRGKPKSTLGVSFHKITYMAKQQQQQKLPAPSLSTNPTEPNPALAIGSLVKGKCSQKSGRSQLAGEEFLGTAPAAMAWPHLVTIEGHGHTLLKAARRA